MNKIIKKIAFATAGLAVSATALLPLADASALRGPNRTTFTLQEPATYVTFNSITNNPAVYNGTGDERDFVKVALQNSVSAMTESAKVTDGQEAYVLAYVHNDARSDLNLVARDVMSKFNISEKSQVVNGTNQLTVTGYVNSSNANPSSVYDDAYFTADKPFSVEYVKDSAFYSNVANGSHVLTDPTTGNGAKLGYASMDGNIPGCMEYSGWVRFKVKVNFDKTSDYTLTKQVRFDGQGAQDWKPTLEAKAGDILNFKLVYTHTGEGTQEHVIIKDVLPAGLEYIKNSTTLANISTKSEPNGLLKIDDDKIGGSVVTNGIDIGGYTNKSTAVVMFNARVLDTSTQPICGLNTITNRAKAITQNDGEKEATASVIVEKICTPPPDPDPTPDPTPTPTPDPTPTPTPPVVIPKTGAEFGGIIGLGSAVTAGAYYLTNRKRS
ncbi:MAG: DUF11 domain-containing protein [Candidatus Nomurabacteria bacterium]|nr:DUF11 domain-containing protein [Candidatus Nomurabacteria bacterium]